MDRKELLADGWPDGGSSEDRIARRLEELLEEIPHGEAILEDLYRSGEKGEYALEAAWLELQGLYRERTALRSRFAGEELPLELAFALAGREISRALEQLSARILELVEEFMPAFEAALSGLADAAGLAGRTISKLVRVGARTRPGPRQIFAPARSGVGPIGVVEFSRALPATRRPVLPGIMRQKGRG